MIAIFTDAGDEDGCRRKTFRLCPENAGVLIIAKAPEFCSGALALPGHIRNIEGRLRFLPVNIDIAGDCLERERMIRRDTYIRFRCFAFTAIIQIDVACYIAGYTACRDLRIDILCKLRIDTAGSIAEFEIARHAGYRNVHRTGRIVYTAGAAEVIYRNIPGSQIDLLLLPRDGAYSDVA